MNETTYPWGSTYPDAPEIPTWAQVSLYVSYKAGRAGIGWGDTARNVRVPCTKVQHALDVFEAVCEGTSSTVTRGIIPDHVRVVVEARPGKSYPSKIAHDYKVFQTYASFNRVEV